MYLRALEHPADSTVHTLFSLTGGRRGLHSFIRLPPLKRNKPTHMSAIMILLVGVFF